MQDLNNLFYNSEDRVLLLLVPAVPQGQFMLLQAELNNVTGLQGREQSRQRMRRGSTKQKQNRCWERWPQKQKDSVSTKVALVYAI